MSKGYKTRGGTNLLNFKVVGGTTEPDNPKENTIWVNTAQKITGWYFHPTQPENMGNGEVWFCTGATSLAAFDALKKNSIMVYPLNANQMVDGALVNVTAKSYQNGEWVDWITYLYKTGDECIDITGGWEQVTVGTYWNKGSVVRNANSITLQVSTKQQSILRTTNAFVPRGNSLSVRLLEINGSLVAGIIRDGFEVSYANAIAKIDITAPGQHLLNIGSVDEKVYVALWISKESGTSSATFDEVYVG